MKSGSQSTTYFISKTGKEVRVRKIKKKIVVVVSKIHQESTFSNDHFWHNLITIFCIFFL